MIEMGLLVYFQIDNRLCASSQQAVPSFDLKDEKFQSIPRPCCSVTDEAVMSLGIIKLGGDLCIRQNDGGKLDIWAYKDQVWVNAYCVVFVSEIEVPCSQCSSSGETSA